MNRVFAVGVLTEQTDVSAGEMIRARIISPADTSVCSVSTPTAKTRFIQAPPGEMT